MASPSPRGGEMEERRPDDSPTSCDTTTGGGSITSGASPPVGPEGVPVALNPSERRADEAVGGEEQEETLLKIPRVVDFGEVAVANKHVFQRMTVTNLTSSPVRMEMSSTVPTLGFQLRNENFATPALPNQCGTPRGNPSGGHLDDDSTSSGLPAQPETLESFNQNQVFNYVNLIKTIELPPLAEQEILLSYRPLLPSRTQPTDLQFRKEGDINVHAWTADGASQKQRVKFSCLCCVSVMNVDPTVLDFGMVGSVPGGSNTKIQEFTISNSSVINLKYLMRLTGTSSALTCKVTGYDRDEPLLDTPLVLEPHHFKRVQVTIVSHPNAVGDHDLQLCIDNLLDDSTKIVTLCATVVAQGDESNPLVVSTPDGSNVVDFGNCYTGVPHRQLITIKNVHTNPLVVSFGHESHEVVRGVLGCRIHDITEQVEDISKSSDTDTPTEWESSMQRDLWLRQCMPGQGASGVSDLQEALLKPGKTEQVELWYTPKAIEQNKKGWSRRADSDRLHPVQFRVFVKGSNIDESAKEKDAMQHCYTKVLTCQARVCTSRVEVKETEVNFGDSVVGKKTTCQVQIVNPCDLPAFVFVKYDSKIMTLEDRRIEIPPGAEKNLEFHMVPHRVNPSFRKQVTVSNLRNPGNTIIINLTSNNIDSIQADTAPHAYYSVRFPNRENRITTSPSRLGSGEKDREILAAQHHRTGLSLDVVKGFPTLRSFKIRSKWDAPLVLDLVPSRSDWVKLYVLNSLKDTPVASNTEGGSVPNSPATDLSQGSSQCQEKSEGPVVPTNITKLLSEYEGDEYLRALPEKEDEGAYVSHILQLKASLETHVNSGSLIPVSRITLPPESAGDESEITLYMVVAVTAPTDKDGIAFRAKRDEKISISVQNVDGVAVRDIPLHLYVAVSQLELGQKNLNLGQVDIGENMCRNISINNRADVPLLFEVSKDKSIGSTQLRIEGRKDQKYVGFVRPYARKEVKIVFFPSLRGLFNEKLTIRNFLDPVDEKTMVIKAEVAKPNTFEVKPMMLEMQVRPNDRSESWVGRTRFTIYNTGRQRTEYNITPITEHTDHAVSLTWEIEAEAVKAASHSTCKVEEEIEALEQKIKIYKRKNKLEKIKRTMQRLEKLKLALAGGSEMPDDGWESVSSSDDESRRERRVEVIEDGMGLLTPPVPRGGTVAIIAALHVKKRNGDRINHMLESQLVVSEARDKEAQQVVQVQSHIVEEEEGGKRLLNSPEMRRDVISPYRETLSLEDDAGLISLDDGDRNGKTSPVPGFIRKSEVHDNGVEAGTLKLSSNSLDFGTKPIGSKDEQSFEVMAVGGKVAFVVLKQRGNDTSDPHEAKVEISPLNGEVVPEKSVKVSVRVTPQSSRLQKYFFEIRNLRNKDDTPSTVAITVRGEERTPAVFIPAAITFGSLYVPADLDGGDRYSSDAPAKTTPFTVKNTTAKTLTLNVESSLPSQSGIVHKGSHRHHPESLVVAPMSELVVHAAAWPRLDRARAVKGTCKKLQGAYTFTSAEHPSWRAELPFSGIVGCAALKVNGPSVVDLGVTTVVAGKKQVGETRGSFTLVNLNKQLCLEWELKTNEDAPIRFDKTEGDIPGDGSEEVTYIIAPRAFGLFQETVEFCNRSSIQAPVKKTLLLLADDQCVSTSVDRHSALGTPMLAMPHIIPVLPLPEPSSPGYCGTPCGESLSAPVIMDSPCVRPVGAVTVTSTTSSCNTGKPNGGSPLPFSISDVVASPHYRTSITLTNHTSCNLSLLPKVDLHGIRYGSYVPVLAVGQCEEDFLPHRLVQGTTIPTRRGRSAGVVWSTAGPRISLPKRKTTRVLLQVRCLPDLAKMSEREREKLEGSRLASTKCYLAFTVDKAQAVWPQMYSPHSLSHNRVVQLLHVHMRFCVPRVEFSPPAIELDRIRGTELVPFNFELRNKSQIPVDCSLNLPPDVLHERCDVPLEMCTFFDNLRQRTEGWRRLGTSPCGISPLAQPTLQVRCGMVMLQASSECSDTHQVHIPADTDLLFHGILDPSLTDGDLEEGAIEREIIMHPHYGYPVPSILRIKATVAKNIWAFETPSWSATGGERKGPIHLSNYISVGPSITSESEAEGHVSHADAKMTIKCTAPLDDKITATLGLEPVADVQDFLNLKLLLLGTNLQITKVVFSREERAVGIRVRAYPKHGKSIPTALADRLLAAVLDEAPEAAPNSLVRVDSPAWAPADTVESAQSVQALLPPLSHALALRLKSVEKSRMAQMLHLAMLSISAPGQPEETLEIWGVVSQTDTFTTNCIGTLTLNPARGEDIPDGAHPLRALPTAPQGGARCYKGSVTVRNLCTEQPLVLHMTILERAWADDDNLRKCIHVTPGYPDIEIPIGGSVDVSVVANFPMAVTEERLQDGSPILFLQDKNCSICYQILELGFPPQFPMYHEDEYTADETTPTSKRTYPIEGMFPDTQGDHHDDRERKLTMDTDPSGDLTKHVSHDATWTSSSEFREDTDPRPHEVRPHLSPVLDSDRTLAAPPRIRLHNCKAIENSPGSEGRHYVVLMPPGSQDGEPVKFKIFVENVSDKGVEVLVRVVRLRHEKAWLKTSCSSLRVMPSERVPLVLTASTEAIGSHTTFVLLQLSNAPEELVSIRCSAEIVASYVGTSGCFDIFVDGKISKAGEARRQTHELDFGEVFFSEQVVHRCIDVANNTLHRLEFNLLHNQPGDSDVDVDVVLSLSHTTLKTFHRLTVEPNQRVRVYLWYQVNMKEETHLNDESVRPRELVTQLVLKCRMVKGHDKIVTLRSQCLHPQLAVSHDEVVFKEDGKREEILEVANLWHEPALVEVRADTVTAFDLQEAAGEGSFPKLTMKPMGRHILKISPNWGRIDALRRHHKEGIVVDEHFTVYNMRFPKEKKYIVLKCMVGSLTKAGRDLLQDTYYRLEERVVAFLRSFQVFIHTRGTKALELLSNMKEARSGDESEASDDEDEDEQAESVKAIWESSNVVEEVLADASDFYFEFRYLTDELVYHGLRGKSGTLYFDLAKLLYSQVLTCDLFLKGVRMGSTAHLWLGQAKYFDTFSSLFGAEIGAIE